MIWVILFTALLLTYIFVRDCVRLITSYTEQYTNYYQGDVHKKRNTISLEITIDMWLAAAFWLIFILLWN